MWAGDAGVSISTKHEFKGDPRRPVTTGNRVGSFDDVMKNLDFLNLNHNLTGKKIINFF